MINSLSSKKFFLDEHGCAKNQVDGELIISHLEDLGMIFCDNPDEADLIIINSCGFIKSAKEESLDSVMQARAAYPKAKILLAGCLAERYAKVFYDELLEVDGIFGNGDISKIKDSVLEIFSEKKSMLCPPQKGVSVGKRNQFLSFPGTAFVKITEGCNNACSFCAIPLIRGSLRSRKISEIVDEIKELLSRGVFEINLIGQDLAAFGCGQKDDVFSNGKNMYDFMYKNLSKPLIDFSEPLEHSPLYYLCEEILKLPQNFWLRLLYIHPDHFNPDVLDLMQKDSRLLPYFDIPFQSGDDSIIKKMNRKGTAASYKKIVSTIREKLPESCIRTTFLTGFPEEGDKEASNTESFLKDIKSDWSGCFSYSKEDDTPAEKFKKQVPFKKAQKRADSLTLIQSEITMESLKNRVGKYYDVLIEEVIENKEGSDEGFAIGRAWFDAPEVDGSFVVRYDLDDEKLVKNIYPGSVVKVKALASSEVDVDGEYLG